MHTYTGGCLCGQIRYRISAAPGAARICWCRDCQKLATNGTANALFPSAAIEITGTPAKYEKTADSGNTVTRRFCPRCGTRLYSDSSGRPGLTVVRLGTLDDPSAIQPSANIWTTSAPSWACMNEGLKMHEAAPTAPPTKK